jgi:hypothetical protein
MRPIKIFLALALFLLCAGCPTARAQWDTPVPIRWVSVLPSTCDPTKRVNVLVYKYSAPIGFYYCSGTNTWTMVNATPLGGITSLNSQGGSSQTFATGTTGADFNIISSGGVHTFSIPTASAAIRGLLSSSDWTTFNNKVTTLNGLTGSTQTFATGTTGTDFNISSSGSAHTFNLPTASGTVRGLLSSSDWNIFSNKLSTLNGLTAATQIFAAPAAADTAAWSSSASTHTLQLPITSITGTSRTNYIPVFTGANTFGKSGITWTSGFFYVANANNDQEFAFQLTQPAGSSGALRLGDYNGTATSYLSLDSSNLPASTTARLQSTAVSLGDIDGTIPGSSTHFEINGKNLGDPNFAFLSNGGIIDFGSAGSGPTVFRFNGTVTTTGVTGNTTINKSFGSVNFAAGATSLVLSSTAIKADSLIFCTVQTNDTTAKSCSVSGTAVGSTTIRLNAAATAETKVAFLIGNISF